MVSVLLLGSSAATGRAATAGDSVRTLSALVSGAVDGVVRDVQLLATRPEPDLGHVAEHAGCGFVAAPDLPAALRAATGQTRSPHVLLLLAGLSFDRALTDEMAGVEGRHDGWLAGGIGLKAIESGPLGRLMPRFAPTVGVLTTRDRLRGLAAKEVGGLWRALRPQRVFKTRAWTGTG